MANILFKDLKPYDYSLDYLHRITEKVGEDTSLHQAMADLHHENVELLDQIIAFEAEMHEQRSLWNVFVIKRKIALLRTKVEKNNREIIRLGNTICEHWQ